MDIADSTFLITGASRGLGRELALHFAKTGAPVILTARSAEGLQETARLIHAANARCAHFVSDLRDPGSLVRLLSHISNADYAVDVLINNAADVTSKPFLDTSIEEIEGIIRTNLIGALQLTRLISPGMLARGRGMIVNISSLAGYRPNPAQTVYSVSKSGVNGISEALQREFRGTPVRVINVALPSVGTDPRQITPQRVCARVERAILRGGPYEVFFSRTTKWLMRLYRFFPPLARLS